MQMPESLESINRTIDNIRDELEKLPAPPNKEELEARLQTLLAQARTLVGAASDEAKDRVAKAAAELEKLVKSARTDPLAIFQQKLAAAQQPDENA
jgi:hypothetical protein